MGGPLEVLLFLTTLHGVGCGLQAGPGYRVYERPCSRIDECRLDLGEVCWWLYDGCDQGQCMCPPATHTPDQNGLCVPMKVGNEACKPGDHCPDDMTCTNGTCQCTMGTMHSAEVCILPDQRLLGQSCNPSTDTCYHKAIYGEYSEQGVRCADSGYCQCEAPGYKQDHESCRRLHVGEWGCSKAFHCEGGAICLDGYCECPSGYKAVAGKTKCAKIGALSELPVNHRCDELNENAYCAKGLKCHRCSRQTQYTCVRYHFLSFEGERQALSSSALPVMPYLPLLSVLLILTSLYTRMDKR